MLIRASTLFKHGRTAFSPGAVYDVPPEFGGYFVGVGWAVPVPAGETNLVHALTAAELADRGAVPAPAPPPAGEAVLEIHDGGAGSASVQLG